MVYKEYLRYFDLFGTKCSFYSDQRLKFYTPLGGVISVISVCAGIIIFTFFNLSNFKREYPSLITMSTIDEEGKLIFNQEKIYIPWTIQQNKSKINFNLTDVLLPTIKYYYKNNRSEILKSKILSYNKCIETPLLNSSLINYIDTPLDQLYCIDMDDLVIGGSVNSNYFYYIEFNLYLCKNNSNCVNFNFNDFNNNLEFLFYYPISRFHENDYSSPLKTKYKKDYIMLNKNTTKINQIFFRKIILDDEIGFFGSKKNHYEYWECGSSKKDFYFMDNLEQKLFSMEILVDQSFIFYYRKYQNIFSILSESLPLIFLVFNLGKLLAKIFKLSSINRKLTELLFENLAEKPNKFQNYIRDMKSKKTIEKLNLNKNKDGINNISNFIKNNLNTNPNNLKSTEENNIISMTNNDNPKNINNYSNVTLINQIYLNKNNNYNLEDINKNSISNKRKSGNYNEGKLIDLNINSFNLNNILQNDEKNNKKKSSRKKKKFVTKKLFPYKFYLCTIFTKNIDITSHPFCMSKKYVKVYYFLCRLLDISSYCILQKEFNVTKNLIFDEKKLQLIEQNTKININDQFFMRDMNDCIIRNKFYILGNNIKKKNETHEE